VVLRGDQTEQGQGRAAAPALTRPDSPPTLLTIIALAGPPVRGTAHLCIGLSTEAMPRCRPTGLRMKLDHAERALQDAHDVVTQPGSWRLRAAPVRVAAAPVRG